VNPAEGTYDVNITAGTESAGSGMMHSADPNAKSKAVTDIVFRTESVPPYRISLNGLEIRESK
jgi:hypothetical protein